ncbi:Biuret amidohydrolase [Scedosporium apiospermum]|uniref:Biuret amidohydrolase n=1 Tax=Pseudallescheria apiosperma TaxID=563466 RepID=A0A084G4A5_PSEDA|nr:Biuret amidohydrolase [Scedosporium apiospermum]KEZ42167.1 Biuret amidohydrolase [Scedosporium apiospermum]
MHNATNIDLTSYATSKAATDHLVKLLAAKFSRFYVRVVGINPGFVPSSMNPIGEEGNLFSALFDQVPAKRAGNEDDIAGTILYLVSRAGAYVDGISLCVDGGRVLLANGQDSDINGRDLRALAAQLRVETLDSQDAEDYLTLLRSLEAVMKRVDDAPDYIAPELLPHKTLEAPGGSSSGSAVLVAAHRLASTEDGSWGHTVELAIGSDQAGSVRIPASYNGIYGLKPTFGLVPYTGAASMSPMIDHLGPLAAKLEDLAVMLEVMAGYDGFDPRMTPESPLAHQVKPYLSMLLRARQEAQSTPKLSQRLRVGLLKESFSMPGVASDVRDTVCQTATRYFEAVGASVVEVSIPLHQRGPEIWTAATRPSMSTYLCQGNPSGHLAYLSPHTQIKWPPSQDTYDTLTSNNPAVVNIMLSERFAREFSKAGVEAKAHRMVFELRAAYDSALEHVDILVTPCAPTVAMPHPDSIIGGKKASILDRLGVAIGLTSNTCPFNVTGHPGLSVPCGSSTSKCQPYAPLPIGMQLVGRRWADEQVIEAAALFERGRELVQNEIDSGK